jgi:hypothetical protein
MRRLSERMRHVSSLSVVLVLGGMLGSSLGCKQVNGRRLVRKANQEFRDTHFIDAAAEYHVALESVPDPIVHYNLGLAYQKIFRPAYDAPILLGVDGDPVCTEIPNTKLVDAGACVKEGDRHFAECGAAKTDPINKQIETLAAQALSETDADKKKDLLSQKKDKEDERDKYTCASSFKCVESKFCSLRAPEIAEAAAEHFKVWIAAQPSDDVIKKMRAEALKELEAAKASQNQAQIAVAQKVFDDLDTKDQTRKIMTQLWSDSDQYAKAIEYWEGLLKDRPNDTVIMGVLAGINRAAGNWRKSIEWYGKVADATVDPSAKVPSYQAIANSAWGKLNSRSLIAQETVEIADRGIAALQSAIALQPKNRGLVALQGALYNFRSTAHGASWAGAIDRASQADRATLVRVLSEEAKKAQQGAAPGGAPAPTTPSTPPTTPPATGGPSGKAGG